MARRPTVTGGRGDGRTVGIIRSVTEPLHVFALFAVVVEVAMGGFAWSVPAADRLPAVLSFAGSIVFLAAVFSLIVFF